MTLSDFCFFEIRFRPVHFERRKQPATSARAHCPLWLSIVRICKVRQQIALHQLADTILQSAPTNHTPPTCGHNCNNLRETDPCDHSATYVADQVRHTCDNCYKSHSTNLRTQFAKCVNKSHSTQPADRIATICGKPTLATTVRRMLRTRCDTRATHVRPPCGTHWCHFHFVDH